MKKRVFFTSCKFFIMTMSLGLLKACFPAFDNPLPEPVNLKVDERILGPWFSSKDNIYIQIYPRSSGWVNVYFLMNELFTEDKTCTQYEGYTVMIGDAPILCLWEVYFQQDYQTLDFNKEKSDKCLLFPYELTNDGTVNIWYLSMDKFEKLIKENVIKGNVTQTRSKAGLDPKRVNVQASSKEIETFFNTVGVKNLVGEKPEMTFSRLIQLPELSPAPCGIIEDWDLMSEMYDLINKHAPKNLPEEIQKFTLLKKLSVEKITEKLEIILQEAVLDMKKLSGDSPDKQVKHAYEIAVRRACLSIIILRTFHNDISVLLKKYAISENEKFLQFVEKNNINPSLEIKH